MADIGDDTLEQFQIALAAEADSDPEKEINAGQVGLRMGLGWDQVSELLDHCEEEGMLHRVADELHTVDPGVIDRYGPVR